MGIENFETEEEMEERFELIEELCREYMDLKSEAEEALSQLDDAEARLLGFRECHSEDMPEIEAIML